MQEQLLEKWTAFWGFLCIGLITVMVAWREGLFRSFQFSSLPEIKIRDVLKGFGFFLFAELLLIPAIFNVVNELAGWHIRGLEDLSTLAKGWLNFFVTFSGFIAISVAYSELTPTQREQLRNQTTIPWYRQWGMGALMCGVGYPLIIAISQLVSIGVWVFFEPPSIEQAAVQYLRTVLSYPILFSLMSLTIVTIVPMTEEYLFRGLLQNWLKRKSKRPFLAIGLSSIVFALFHYLPMQGTTNIELITTIFFLSCLMGYTYERQRSLWASIGFHSTFNLISLLFMFQK